MDASSRFLDSSRLTRGRSCSSTAPPDSNTRGRPQKPAVGLDWLDSGSLVVNQVADFGGPGQLWRVAYPGGVETRLTNDVSDYVGVSVTAARDSLVTARRERRVAISVSDSAGGHVKEVVSPVSSSGSPIEAVAWAGDRVLFASVIGGHPTISSVQPDGGTPQEVAAKAGWPTATSDGRTIVFRSTDLARPGFWKITDGGRPVQLTAPNPAASRL